MSANAEQELEALLDYLKRTRGFDFTGYKRSSLARRIQKRMLALGLRQFGEYLDYLQVHPDEFPALFNDILINVTGFLRDTQAWAVLREEIIPRLVAQKPPNSLMRVWSAGCASGEEAYTLAMVMCDVLGIDEFKARVKIYATDVDQEALALARQATYGGRDVESLSDELRQTYFETTDARYTFRKDLRRNVVFGRHDLIQDAPISRVDVLVCRNTLMYFNAETQAKILVRFHFALKENGVLFLGRAETLLTQTNLFTPLDLKRRIFSKVPRLGIRDRLLMMAQGADADGAGQAANHVRAREAAFDASPVAQLVVDVNGDLVLVNHQARVLCGLAVADIGRPLRDFETSYRPLELRSLIDQANTDRAPVLVRDVEWPTAAGMRVLDVSIAALMDPANGLIGTCITLKDVTREHRLRFDLEHSKQELETAYEELQSTVEELETTNEELQSTVEELETTNEELQSTTEELETMNEELQSTNEELQTINDEVRRRSEDLNEVNAFLESILTSIRRGVVVLDRDFEVQIWNSHAEALWGLRSDEVLGRSFLNLDIGLPVERLKQPIRKAMLSGDGSVELSLDATNRRGRAIKCTVTLGPLTGGDKDVRGVILLMDGDTERDAGERRPKQASSIGGA
jgi:two-component system, chemotaxis family, CheB/CheR fusion protein